MGTSIAAHDPSGPSGHLPIDDDGEEVISTNPNMF